MNKSRSRARRAGRSLLWAAALVALSGGAACHRAPPVSRTAAEIARDVGIPPNELRIRVRAAAGRLSSLIEGAADRIATGAGDPSVRRAALVWKIEAIPELQESLFRPDPYLAVYDTWAFSVQMSEWFRTGKGEKDFGGHSSEALAASEHMKDEMEKLAARVATSKQDQPRGTRFIRDWASKHPIESAIAGRVSLSETRTRLAAEPELGFLATVGSLTESISDVQARLDLANAYLPKMARWQGELLLLDATGRLSAGDTLKNLDALMGALTRATKTLEDAPDLVARERTATLEQLRNERIAVLKSVHAEVGRALDRLTEERLAVAASVEESRAATIEALVNERKATLRDLEEMSRRLGRDAAGGIKDSLRGAFIWIAILGSIPVAAWIGGVLLILRRMSRMTVA